MAPRVFISYSHDNQEHMDRVWELSEKLRGDGVDCRIDQHEESPAEGWPRWCTNQVRGIPVCIGRLHRYVSAAV